MSLIVKTNSIPLTHVYKSYFVELVCQSESAEDIVKSIAEQLNVSFDEETNECCINLPENIGSGYLRAVTFEFGISVLQIDALLQKKLSIVLERDSIQTLNILFNLDSTISHSFEKQKDVNKVLLLECLMSCCQATAKQTYHLKKGSPTTFFVIIINRKLFEAKIESFLKDMNEDLELLFRDVNGINEFYHKSFFTLDISKLIEDFKSCDLTDFMKSTYLEGKCYEILTLQLHNYLTDISEPDGRTLLRKTTINKIQRAVDIIESELEIRINVNSLAKKVGLNQNTLQNGFKILFRKSVNEYIQHQKLERAKDLLENSALNITEITYKIGINSRSYFSKLFKQRFGVTPNQYLTQSRKKVS